MRKCERVVSSLRSVAGSKAMPSPALPLPEGSGRGQQPVHVPLHLPVIEQIVQFRRRFLHWRCFFFGRGRSRRECEAILPVKCTPRSKLATHLLCLDWCAGVEWAFADIDCFQNVISRSNVQFGILLTLQFLGNLNFALISVFI